MEKKIDKPAVEQEKKSPKSVADKIWEDIKDVRLEMFALPNQFVNSYCEPVSIEPTKLYLKTSASAALPALELALKDKYMVEQVERYICVSTLPKKI